VPSGETYIAPLEGTAEGSIVINGSLPGLVLEPDAELILHFEQGRLARLDPPDGTASRWLHETQIAKAQAAGDLNWSSLAEIGIGVNPAVEQLTGNMLLDEKAAGTAHIALGNNVFMGGLVSASIHCDMVTRQPTVSIDGRTIMDHGRLHYVEEEWQESHSRVVLADSPLATATEVARSGVQASRTGDGRLQRVLRPEPGRVSACFVGDHQTARFAQNLYRLIPDDGIAIEPLASRANMDVDLARRVLHILWEYELIRV
jgi:hypothetical protein